ncbi:hypothetical protein MY11210_007903 [Beauveria gryllotalpidicola]
MNFNQLPHKTVVRVNDVQYQAFGAGNANKGELSTQLEHDFDFDPVILAPFLIVGYPTYSEYKPGATDLFKPSTLNGGYKYERHYDFSNGASFTSNHNILFSEEQGLQGVFSTRDFPREAFKGSWEITDLVETFIPYGPGVIKSIMGVEWRGQEGKRLQAVIKSQYLLNHNEELPGLHWRHVTFDTEKVSRSTYIQSEKITVINKLDFGRPANMLGMATESVPVSKASKLEALKGTKLEEQRAKAVGADGHSNGRSGVFH